VLWWAASSSACAETFVKGSATLSQYSDVITFILLIIVLLVKPTGLFGEKIKEKV
jgi:branched-chain amino acid transport system permease protein